MTSAVAVALLASLAGCARIDDANCDPAAPTLLYSADQLPYKPPPARHVRAGDDLTAYGAFYFTGCADPKTMKHVKLALRDANGKLTELATAEPGGDQFRIKATVAIPRDAATGYAVITDQLGTAETPERILPIVIEPAG